jgi:soluble lytic murein transglycosylase-like protein
MSIKPYLTIADYLRQTNPQKPTARHGTTLSQDDRFSKIFKALTPTAASQGVEAAKPAGRTAADYLAKPVPALRRVVAGQAPAVPSPLIQANNAETTAAEPAKRAAEPSPAPSIPTPLVSRLRSARGQGPQAALPSPADNSSLRQKIDHCVAKAADKYDLPKALIHSVIKAESDFQPHAVSPAGASGLMQLMPATARDLGVSNAFDIDQNIDGGARYLRQMLDMFDGHLPKALAAYNAGPGTVQRHNGIPPYEETRDYVKKVISLSQNNG